ncbi:hypothetical protein FE848_15415 [Marinobacter sp. 1-3A]|uniref:hypothetical protein n=1 Tax=Marinobacter sp. 1-3A TaxID=2582920 RepID=UPI0019068F00|nr:hypothetical protein [Marinobacter sp. 1-3A]MBK1874614.1 hypothetical protein [Marinobacter sp. 1-3A]
MTKLTLSKTEMIDDLYLAAEEVTLQCMILNRRKLVQAFIYMHPHVENMNVKIMPANTVHREGVERPEPLGVLDIKLKFWDNDDLDECKDFYSEQMEKIELFIRYLDHLITAGKRIEAEIKKEAA